MKKQLNLILLSMEEFKSTKSLVVLSLLVALNVILGFFSVTISPTIKVGFAFLANSAAGFLFGPIPAGIAAAMCDIIKYLIKPDGPYFPGFTISAFIGGFVYGICFYKKKITMSKCIFSKVFISLFVNIGLNTLWLSVLTSKYFLALLPLRITKNIITTPFEIVFLYLFLKKVIEPNQQMVTSKSINRTSF